MIAYAVEYSYGKSPDTGANDWTFCTYPDGDVVGNYITAVDDSYGRKDCRTWIMSATLGESATSGDVNYGGINVSDSYG